MYKTQAKNIQKGIGKRKEYLTEYLTNEERRAEDKKCKIEEKKFKMETCAKAGKEVRGKILSINDDYVEVDVDGVIGKAETPLCPKINLRYKFQLLKIRSFYSFVIIEKKLDNKHIFLKLSFKSNPYLKADRKKKIFKESIDKTKQNFNDSFDCKNNNVVLHKEEMTINPFSALNNLISKKS